MHDALGDRMKENYEDITRHRLPRRTYTIIRLDGKAFHTYTRKLQRPFDQGLIEDMQKTTVALCEQIEGVAFAYTQSDEISLLLTDFANTHTEAWFKGNIQKMVSVSASIATAAFNLARLLRGQQESFDGALNAGIEPIWFVHPGRQAHFDARVFTIPDRIEVENYFIWRQQDATRNAIQMAAQSMYSHKQLHGKGWSDLNEMLFEKGVNFNDYHSHCKRGSVVVKRYGEYEMEHPITKQKLIVNRGKWTVLDETPMFTDDAGRTFLRVTIPSREQELPAAFVEACKRHGIQPISGKEAYFVDDQTV